MPHSLITTASAVRLNHRISQWPLNYEKQRRSQIRFSVSSSSSSSTSSEKNLEPEYVAIDSSHQHAKSYKLDGYGEGSMVKITTNTGHVIKTDVPKSMGGKDSAPQPVETLLAAWMGCTQATAMFVGRQLFSPSRVVDEQNPQQKQNKNKIRIERLEFDEIVAVRDERGSLQLPIETLPEIPSRIQRITGTIRVYLTSAKPSQKNDQAIICNDNIILTKEEMDLLKEQTEKRCPVANMILASGCSIDVDWIQGAN